MIYVFRFKMYVYSRIFSMIDRIDFSLRIELFTKKTGEEGGGMDSNSYKYIQCHKKIKQYEKHFFGFLLSLKGSGKI